MDLSTLMDNWIVVAVIFPVVLGLFKAEIGKLITAWNIYRLRAFDLDGDPSTSDTVQLLNGATGQWGDVIIEKYVFCFSSAQRGVYLKYPDGGREKVSLLLWGTFRKRTPPPSK